MRSGAEGRRLFWAVALALLVVDFVSKRVAEQALLPIPPVEVLGDWIQLRLVYNQGAAFGLHLGPWSRWIFLIIAVVAVVLLYRLARSSPVRDRLRQLSCGLVAGGAAGNLVDRIRSSQGVVDFIDVGWGAHRWPTFNAADIGVSCGAIALAISLWLEDARRSRTHPASQA
jgi:signal peptidase II